MSYQLPPGLAGLTQGADANLLRGEDGRMVMLDQNMPGHHAMLLQLQNSERTVFLAVLEAQQREAEEDNRYLLGRTEGAWTESPKLELPVGIEPFVLLPQAGALLARLELSGNIFKRNALDTSRADRLLCHRHKINGSAIAALWPAPLPGFGEP